MRGQLRTMLYGLINLKLTSAVSPMQAVAKARVTGGKAKYASESEFPNPWCTFAMTVVHCRSSGGIPKKQDQRPVLSSDRLRDCLCGGQLSRLVRQPDRSETPRLDICNRTRHPQQLALQRFTSRKYRLLVKVTGNTSVNMACAHARAYQLCSPLFLRSLAPSLPASRDHGKYRRSTHILGCFVGTKVICVLMLSTGLIQATCRLHLSSARRELHRSAYNCLKQQILAS